MSDDHEIDDGFDGAFDEVFGSWDTDPGERVEQTQPLCQVVPNEGSAGATQSPHSGHSSGQQSFIADINNVAGGPHGNEREHPAKELHGFGIPEKQPYFTILESPKEVLIRIMSFLSAEDLKSVGTCCQQFHALSSEDVLWRRLFCARWGKPTQSMGNIVWKEKYADSDSEEFQQTLASAPLELHAVFSEMQRAKRQKCLGRALVDDTAELPRCHMQRQLIEWRRQKGFPDKPVPKPDLTKRTLRFHGIEPDLFVCEDTGWVHICDASCREGIIDADSGLITCPVSGRTSQHFMSHHEEVCLQQRSVDACFAAVDQELNSFSAARAYTEGYYADAKEMRQRYGVRLR